jgi:hypothetical protein
MFQFSFFDSFPNCVEWLYSGHLEAPTQQLLAAVYFCIHFYMDGHVDNFIGFDVQETNKQQQKQQQQNFNSVLSRSPVFILKQSQNENGLETRQQQQKQQQISEKHGAYK